MRWTASRKWKQEQYNTTLWELQSCDEAFASKTCLLNACKWVPVMSYSVCVCLRVCVCASELQASKHLKSCTVRYGPFCVRTLANPSSDTRIIPKASFSNIHRVCVPHTCICVRRGGGGGGRSGEVAAYGIIFLVVLIEVTGVKGKMV